MTKNNKNSRFKVHDQIRATQLIILCKYTESNPVHDKLLYCYDKYLYLIRVILFFSHQTLQVKVKLSLRTVFIRILNAQLNRIIK